MDDVVDLSMGRDAVSLSNATVRDLRALTQNAGLTITPAPPSVNNGMCISPSADRRIHSYFISSCYTRNYLHNFVPNQSCQIDTEPYSRRVLRPRTEPKSYAEAPDIVLLPAKINGRQQNGNIDSDTDDEEMPPIIAIKVKYNKLHVRKDTR